MMHHAEASNFASGLTKKDVYAQVVEHSRGLFDGQRNWVCLVTSGTALPSQVLQINHLSNLSNASSLIYHALHSLPSPSSAVNWCGFYVLDPTTPSQLLLGPFQGHVACQTIGFGRGVCGTAASAQTTQLVKDVEAFPGHIACDAASKSEIVVPIIQKGKVVAIIDIDCAELNGFDEDDKEALETIAALLAESCDF